MHTVLLASVLSLRMVQADLPVHCLRHQLLGEWEFTLAPSSPTRTSCGHAKPDSPDKQPPLSFVTAGDNTKKQLTLQDPNTVSSEGSSGTWTMIYDEGFEVNLDDTTFFAFSKFEFVQDPVKGKTNVSHCDQTEVGWYHNKARNQWGCYFGRMVNSPGDSTQRVQPARPHASLSALEVSSPNDSGASLLASDASASSLSSDASLMSSSTDALDKWLSQPTTAHDKTSTSLDGNMLAAYGGQGDEAQQTNFDRPLSAEWHNAVAQGLNLLQLGWDAHPYEQFSGMSARQMNKFAGIRRKLPRDQKSSPAPTFLGVSSKRHRMNSEQLLASEEPAELDYRNKDGTNWLEGVITQGDCGSCYAIATLRMLSVRNRIRANDAKASPFSINFPLYCSEYNQGCDGGYGFLQSKWSEDVGLVPESCAPYTESGTCSLQANCDLGAKRYRAVNHGYVGGFYGGGDEQHVKAELVRGGPVVMSFEPKEDFMYYKNGIYKSGPNQIHQEWEQVDHAVLLSGYGGKSENGYWLLQNSWGSDWGEDGFFRMARGIDESGCESIVVAADVVEEDTNPTLDAFVKEAEKA